MSKVEAAATDPYARITGRILEQLEQGVRPWTSRGAPSTSAVL